MNPDRERLLQFWFQDIPEAKWWEKDAAFDEELRLRFGRWHAAATRGELAGWRDGIRGRLAEILLLDQFSRNLYRDSARAYAWDDMALALSQEAIATGAAAELPPRERAFLYMPFMHSESRPIHEVALRLFAEPGLEGNFAFEQQHKAIIDRFGRYPHRNEVLGRLSTPAEISFLSQPGSGF